MPTLCPSCSLVPKASCRVASRFVVMGLRSRRHLRILLIVALEHVRASAAGQCHECWRYSRGLPVVAAEGA